MVCDDVDRRGGAFEVVAPVPECFEDSKQFLIVGIVVQLRSGQSPGVVGDRINFSVGAGNRQDTGDSVVGGIGFHDDRGIQNEVSENGRSSEGMLKCIERTSTVLREVPRGILLGELGKGNHNVGVVKDELAVEIGEA